MPIVRTSNLVSETKHLVEQRKIGLAPAFGLGSGSIKAVVELA
jgi:hypothetical protein